VGDQGLFGNAARETLVKRRAALAALAALVAAPLARAQTQKGALEKIRDKGRVSVGVYQDLPPFHVNGQGIDVEIARGIAKALGVELSLMPFAAGENMDDDLRNMVWRGHYLGWGPADVLLHVPVDAPLMNANPQVQIFAPYYRERLMLARDVKKLPTLSGPADLKGHQLAVPGLSLAGWLLIGAEGGAWREFLSTKLADGVKAAQALAAGEVAAAAGQASELESVLAGDPRFVIEPLPMPQARHGWAIGCAVKKESSDLAQAVQAAVQAMAVGGDLARAFGQAKVSWRQP
jgi:ABC-type amino acid transport substrate-binding protein